MNTSTARQECATLSLYTTCRTIDTASAWACKMGEPTRGGRAEPSSRDQNLRRERGQKLVFVCLADHLPDWQPRILLGTVEPMLSFAGCKNSTALTSLHCSIRSRVEVNSVDVCGFDVRRGSPELQQVRLPVRFSRRRTRFGTAVLGYSTLPWR